MSRKFIASILAASLAITSLAAAPARADQDDLARFLVGTTALVIIGAALSNRNSNDSATVEVTRRRDVERPRPRRNTALPGFCRSRVWTRDGNVRFMDGRCLRQNYDQARDLPRACRIRVGEGQHTRRGYEMRCLRNRGYTVARN